MKPRGGGECERGEDTKLQLADVRDADGWMDGWIIAHVKCIVRASCQVEPVRAEIPLQSIKPLKRQRC